MNQNTWTFIFVAVTWTVLAILVTAVHQSLPTWGLWLAWGGDILLWLLVAIQVRPK